MYVQSNYYKIKCVWKHWNRCICTMLRNENEHWITAPDVTWRVQKDKLYSRTFDDFFFDIAIKKINK